MLEAILPYLGVEAVYTEKELANMALTVPALTSWSVGAAQTTAGTKGFTVEVVGNGSVVKYQTPAAGTKVESAHAKIVLYTEAGAERTQVAVPDLLKKTAVAANETLANRGLNIRIKGTNNYLSGSGALAVAQDPAPGTMVDIGTVVTVTFRNDEDPE